MVRDIDKYFVEQLCFQAWGSNDIYTMKVVVAPKGYEDMSEKSQISPDVLLRDLGHNSYALPSYWEAVCV